MKYIKPYVKSKLIFLVLALLMSFSLCSCEDNVEEESSVPEETSVPVTFSVEDALELIRRDRLVTEMFVCNSLCNKAEPLAESVFLEASHEYYNFSRVKELFETTYAENGEELNFFLNYPEIGEPAVSEVDGKTKVFYHKGSNYQDFIDESTVTVSDTESENEKTINAKTISGKEIRLKALLSDEKWLLTKGIYLTNPEKSEKLEEVFPVSGFGSMASFSGDVLVIELFVSDRENAFTPEEESSYHKKISSAMDYIIAQSEGYGNNVTVSYDKAYFHHDGKIGNRVLDFDIAFSETGFGTLAAFAYEVSEVFDYDNYLFVVCLDNDMKTEYRLYKNTDQTDIYFAERVYIGQNSTDAEICTSVLSLMGAYGYNEGICDAYTESLFKSYFPNEIMLTHSLTFSEMSPVTAYACGITWDLAPLYRIFMYN